MRNYKEFWLSIRLDSFPLLLFIFASFLSQFNKEYWLFQQLCTGKIFVNGSNLSSNYGLLSYGVNCFLYSLNYPCYAPTWLPLLPLATKTNHHSTYWHCTSTINGTILISQAAHSPYYHASTTQGYKDKINTSLYFLRIKFPHVGETQIWEA